jgi:hypothetical protein
MAAVQNVLGRKLSSNGGRQAKFRIQTDNKHTYKPGIQYCLKLAITAWEQAENNNNEMKV